jgi:ABC-2 type transport system ATP-binding protein
MTVIHLEGVSKHYGRVPALCDVHLRIDHGLTVVVGPSGSGKTTLSEIIAGWRPCDDGRVLFPEANGSGPPRIGLAPQDLAVYPTLTVGENLQIFAELARYPGLDTDRQIAAVAVLLGLRDVLGLPVGSLSTGQQRCVQTALALVANPAVLLLDEPTAGVVGDERRHLLDVVHTLAGEGRTVILTTGDLTEVELLAPNQVVVLDHGVVRFAGTLTELPGRDLQSTYLQLVDRGRENVLAP